MERESLFELRRTTFDTPEFHGIEFIEAECKSIINRVPGAFLPFNWTINPYRGCSHACSYCAAGDTPILMRDGRTRPLADIREGDELYGTVFDGKYRRYVTSRVLDHWQTVRSAFRITLGDGTALVASGDHRFLTDRGWKHVTGTMHGREQRSYLTTNNRLIGTGRFPEPPKDTSDYRRGYLCGMIRGDGTLKSYAYVRARGGRSEVHQFRLALTDREGLARTAFYLSEFGVPTTTFPFPSSGKPMDAIRTQRRAAVDRIRSIVEWPLDSTDDWLKGFLAGIHDAEGSYANGTLRISNTDPEMIRWTIASLARLGFRSTVESKPTVNPVMVVRLLGGRRESLRFFLTVDPAITRKRTIPEGAAIKHSSSRLGVVSIEPLGIDMPMYDLTTTTGDFIANGVVSHNCFARVTHTYMDMDAGRDFESKIVVKVNAPEVLRAQLGAKRWKGEHIAMGTATDPYQRAEGRYRLMPRILAALTDYRNPFSILTKGTLILRDLELLRAAAQVTNVSTAFSIGTLDEAAWRASEPGTPHPRARIEAVAALNEAGIPCGVLMAPILPGITDRPEQLREVIRACLEAGATHVSPILLHLRPGIREEYLPWLGEHYPDLVPRYQALYAQRSGYAPKREQDALRDTVRDLILRAGGTRPRPDVAARFRREERGRGRPSAKPAHQLSLLEPNGARGTLREGR